MLPDNAPFKGGFFRSGEDLVLPVRGQRKVNIVRNPKVCVTVESGKGMKELKGVDEKRFARVCTQIREDGAYVEAGENDNLIVQKLEANPKALGVFGYSFLEENLNKLHGSLIEGKEPTFENIASGAYPVSRSLYFYVKKAHVGVIPGIKEFVTEFTSEKAVGDEGYLADKGLIPLPKDQRDKVRKDTTALTPLKL